MEKKIFLMSLLLPLFLAGCIEKTDEPDADSRPNLGSLEHYYLRVGEEVPVPYTKFMFNKNVGLSSKDPEFAYYNMSGEGRNDKYSFRISLQLVCYDQEMISEGAYITFGTSSPGTYGLDKVSLSIYDLSAKKPLKVFLGAKCYITRIGDDLICEYRADAGVLDQDGNVDKSSLIPVVTVVTFNEKFMDGKVYTADY